MTQNRFDQASRYVAKLDPGGTLRWLFGGAVEFDFLGWLDTRTLPFPGETDRTCDTVAWLRRREPLEDWAVPLEFSLQPDATMFGRLLGYLALLWRERRPTDAGRFAVGAAVVNLTGQGQASRDMQLAGMRTCLQVVERNLARDDADAMLAGVAAGTVARCLLPWVPLMQRGDEAGIMQRWRELAVAEPDAHLRGDLGGLALVFAEAANRLEAWTIALEGWNVVESQVVLGWINQGEAKAKIQALLRLLEKKFPPGAVGDTLMTIKATKDLDLLARWFDAAIDAGSLDDFRKTMAP